MSKLIDSLDAVYARTFDGDVTPADRAFVVKAMDAIISRCDDFLVNAVRISTDSRAKFRKIRNLACEESHLSEKKNDVLTHWPLLRDFMQSIEISIAEKTI